MAEELGVEFHKETKEEIVNSILNFNVPLYLEGSPLDIHHFNQVQYTPLDSTLLPDLPFSAIVRFMVDRKINGRPVVNFRGLDRASKHFEAGDVKQKHPNGHGKVFVIASGDRVDITRAWTSGGMLLPCLLIKTQSNTNQR